MSATPFEDTIRDIQTTAENLTTSKLKLDGALRAINQLLVRSWGHEIVAEVPITEAIYATHRRPDLGSPVNAIGIHRFEYCADEKHPLSQELALGLRYAKIERNPDSGDEVRSLRWVPLVPLHGSGAPPIASRRLRAWAGQNLPYLIALLSDTMAKRVEDIAAKSTASRGKTKAAKKGN